MCEIIFTLDRLGNAYENALGHEENALFHTNC